THYEYQVPIYVLAAKHPLKMAKGENKQLKFTFITTGIDDAVAKAKATAGRKNVMIIGLTDAAQQAIKLKKVDEVILRIVPVNFEKGIKLFENFGKKKIKLKIIESTQYPTRIDIKAKVRS
ncbi:MAG: dihydrofolate reductase, partial [Saprospiraceae bacterium]